MAEAIVPAFHICVICKSFVCLLFFFCQIFGPVMQIMKFKDMDDLIERANNTIYGLAASVFSSNIDKINMVASAVRAGVVW